MESHPSQAEIRTVVTAKNTRHYRIVTDDPDNWHLVVNQPISRGEQLTSPDHSHLVNVGDVDFVDVILEETQERKRIYTTISAVPSDSSCVPTTLEIPWCFMNHSCEPNTHDQWKTDVPANLKLAETVATRDIGADEELTFNYNLEQYDYRSPFECQCGVESCSGSIQGFNGLSGKQQEELLPYTSPFVQEKHQRASLPGYIDVSPKGRHIVIDYWSCNADLLNNETELSSLLFKAADAAGAKVISTHSHKFEHQGVTAVVILAESHITIHSWPGIGYAGVDIYTCGDCEPLQAHQLMKEALSCDRAEYMQLTRGNIDFPHSIAAIPNKHLLHTGLSENDSCFIEGTVPGRRHGNINHGFHISQLVLKERTKFQECLIFDNPVYGRVLVLDGIVQLSTFDEYIYHEMLVHPPMLAHPNPRRVCIVGGGDGGTLREVLRHNPEEVVMIDIDEQFVRSAEKYLPSLSAGTFSDPRVTLLFEDASQALQRYKKSFDVAIIDCNDAIGPSEALFESDFYATVSRALKDDAVCTVQTGSMLDMEFIDQTRERMERHLGRTSAFKFTMPCYHCGEYVFVVASKSVNPSGPDIDRLTELQTVRNLATKYWSPEIHHASQVFPLRLG